MSTIVPDQAYGLNLDPATTDALAHFARRRKVLLVLRAIAAGTVVLIATMLVVALCDYLWFLSDSVRWSMSVVGYTLVLATMWWQGLGRLGQNDPKRLARQLESAEPRLREDLLSAVELADPNLVNGSEGFRQRLQRRVAQRIAGIDIGRLLPMGLLRRWISTGLFAVAVCIGLLLIPQMQFGRRIARAMLPGMAIQRASLTEVTIIQPSPPTGFVAEGDAVAVVVRVIGTDVKDVMLRWRTEEGVDGETEMTPRVGPVAADSDGTLSHDDVYAANLSIGSVPVDYQVLAGDAITLWHTLTPLPRPRVASFEKRYVFPHYAKLGDRIEQAEHGDLKALIGSTATVTVEFDEPVDNAVLRYAHHGIELPLEAVDSSKQRFVTSIAIKTPSHYQIDATSVRSNLNNPFGPQYSITPVVDSPPVVHWSAQQPISSLVSPLDVLTLSATASDDLPMDRVVQEFIVNSEAMLQREIPVAQSSRELELKWDWDLMRRTDGEVPIVKLTSGDIVRTRTVAIDRRGNRGESRWIEFLVTDEGFDADRHAPLDRLGALTVKVSDWAMHAKELAKRIGTINKKDEPVDYESIRAQATELHEAKASMTFEFHSVLESSRNLPEANTWELVARAVLELDQKIAEIVSRWSDVREHDHPAWQRNRDQALREIVGDSHRVDQESTRLDQLVRSAFAQKLTVGLVADGMSLQNTLQPLLDDKKEMPAMRFPRYLAVAVGRLDAIDQLMEKHTAALPESTRRHLESWHRWSQPWSARLGSASENKLDLPALRGLVTSFNSELTNQVNNAIVDGQLKPTLNNMYREVQNQVGPTADKVRRLTNHGNAAVQASQRIEKEEDADKVAGFHRDKKLAEADWTRALTTLRGRLDQEEALHRSRAVVDLQYAADIKLMNRAIENVTAEGYQPYRDEPAADIYDKLAGAFQLLEASHHADAWHQEMLDLLDAERRLESTAQAKIMHPWWIERYSVGMEWPIRYLRASGVPPEEVDPLERSRHSQNYNDARSRISARQWSREELLTADAALTQLERELSISLVALEPRKVTARETIRQYVLTLAEQARDAAEKAQEAKERTETRADSEQETAEDLNDKQAEAAEAARKTVESLVDLANTAEITDQQQRELARDADAAAAQIQDAVERAEEQMNEAVSAETEQQRSEALDSTAEALQDLTETLERTAEHFEKADSGQDITESREQLRQSEQELEIQDQLQQRYYDAEEMANAAESTPEELMDQLERELQQNEPMQEELSEIAQKAAEAAQRTLEQAARDEKSLNESLERSDPQFQEQKRRAAKQLSNLAQRAATVDQSLLNAAEQAVGWANEPEARPKLAEARGELRKAVQQANQLGGENALLADMQQTAKVMSEAIETASEAIDAVQQQTDKAADKNIHENEPARQQTQQRVEQFERTARNQRVQAVNNEKRQWSAAEREANQRVQAAQRNKRSLEDTKRRIQQQLAKNPNNAESLKQQAAELQQRVDDVQRSEDAAKESSQFAAQKGKEADQRSREIAKQKVPPLEKANPAAELASRMTDQAGDELDSIRQELSELAEAVKIEEQLRTPASQAQQMVQQQERIQQEVADAAEQLQRAARHEDRLGQSEMAQQLKEAADMIAESAVAATEQAAEALAAAASDPGQAPRANQEMGQATEQISAAAEKLGELLAANPTTPTDPAAASDSSEDAQQGQQMARTLDELDRAMAQQQQGQGEQTPGQSEQTPGQDEPPQDSQAGQPSGQQPGQQPGQPTAADASPTLANALNSQAQQAARQRQQQMTPGQGEQPGQPGEPGEPGEPGQPGQKSASTGEMPAGGSVETDGIDRIGGDWGQLRERRTEDATESQQTMVAPQYRREIEAYFRAVARRASEKSQ